MSSVSESKQSSRDGIHRMRLFPVVSGQIGLIVAACLIISFFTAVDAASQEMMDVGKFSAGKAGNTAPKGWKPFFFRNIVRHTSYSIVEDNGVPVVMAESDASASGLIREIKIDPKEYPVIRWKWKVQNILEKGDVGRKEGDDYPARIYVTFQYDPAKAGFLGKAKYEAARLIYGKYPPHAAITYIWESRSTAGLMTLNPYTDRNMMFVVESGSEKLNMWIREERNILEDYRRAFGEDPPLISGVAIMTDTDNTGEKATAFFGDIRFGKRPVNK